MAAPRQRSNRGRQPTGHVATGVPAEALARAYTLPLPHDLRSAWASRSPGGAIRTEGTSTVSTSYGFVSTYPPTQCELVSGSGDDGLVVRLVESPQPRPAPEVKAQLIAGDSVSMRGATAALNGCDVAIVQHEFGVYGGPDGSEVLPLLDMLQIPCVVIVHTVLTSPATSQRAVL